jgi:putative phosphoesterase
VRPSCGAAGVAVGLIADTHGLLRPEALEALAGVQYIIHAGDVGPATILEQLGRIAPVTAVRGNVDRDGPVAALPLTAELDVAGAWIHARHVVDELDFEPAAAGVAAVVFGHSHRPEIFERRGVLFVNPGSAGPRRFKLPVSVARLEVRDGAVSARLIEIVQGGLFTTTSR